MFGFRKKRLKLEDLPVDVRERMALLEIEMMEGGDPTEVLRFVARKYPGYVPARLNLASHSLASGDTAAARATYAAVAKDFPDEPGATAGLASVEVQAGNLAEAERLASQALSSGYHWPPCYGIIAESHEHRGDREGAAQWYLRGYRRHPHSWDYLQHHCRLTNQRFTPPTEKVEPVITHAQLEDLAASIRYEALRMDERGYAPGCDNTFRFTESWAEQNGVDIIRLYQFLNAHGGFCDCEVGLNVTELLDGADELDDRAPSADAR